MKTNAEQPGYTAGDLPALREQYVALLLAKDGAARSLRDIRRDMSARQKLINEMGDVIESLEDGWPSLTPRG